jgi:hypothetical protein
VLGDHAALPEERFGARKAVCRRYRPAKKITTTAITSATTQPMLRSSGVTVFHHLLASAHGEKQRAGWCWPKERDRGAQRAGRKGREMRDGDRLIRIRSTSGTSPESRLSTRRKFQS